MGRVRLGCVTERRRRSCVETGLKEDAVAFLVEKMRIDDNMRWGGVVVVVSVSCYGDEEDDDVMMKVVVRR